MTDDTVDPSRLDRMRGWGSESASRIEEIGDTSPRDLRKPKMVRRNEPSNARSAFARARPVLAAGVAAR